VIFTSETFVWQWMPKNFDSTWKVSNSTKGWTNNEHRMMWLKQCFKPVTQEKADGRHRLLICDGHNSHCTADFLTHCIEHKILLLLHVPHSSYIVQPLDAGLFRVVKQKLSEYIAPTLKLDLSRIQKSEWLEAYYLTHMDSFTVNNIKSTFSSTGIHPFNPTKAFNGFHLTHPHLSATPYINALPQTLTTATTVATTPFPT
jgi:DDE superfamily endonuclease